MPAAARFPESPAVALAAVKALLAIERRADASDVLKELCGHKPNFTEAWEKWAIVAAMAGRYADEFLAGMSWNFDLVTAMDVQIYIGDGVPFLREASIRLEPAGLLAVSLETSDDVTDVRLERTTRFVKKGRRTFRSALQSLSAPNAGFDDAQLLRCCKTPA